MTTRWVRALIPLLLLGALCGSCLWGFCERSRFSQTLAIEDGRTVRVWSVRRSALEMDPDYNPHVVYYRIDRGWTELVPRWSLELDDGDDYRFAAVTAEGGRLACVYEVDRRLEYLTILYDAESGESWPRDSTNWHVYPEVRRKWRERFERVLREYPDCPVPRKLWK
jgi:hypothetical protein